MCDVCDESVNAKTRSCTLSLVLAVCIERIKHFIYLFTQYSDLSLCSHFDATMGPVHDRLVALIYACVDDNLLLRVCKLYPIIAIPLKEGSL